MSATPPLLTGLHHHTAGSADAPGNHRPAASRRRFRLRVITTASPLCRSTAPRP